jgi:hypothetical protein
MKRIAALLVLVFGFSFTVLAHPPTDIIITYDLQKSAVFVDIMHGSKDILKHFIVQITVLLNDKEMIKQKAITQTSNEKQTVMYVIPGLKPGDKISVNADCSIFGDLTKEVVVKAPAPAQQQETKKPSSKPEAKASSKFRLK